MMVKPRYRFIGWDKFAKSLRAARVVLVRGDFGTGKTLFSVGLGYHLLKNMYVNVCAFNFPASFGSAPRQYRCFGVIDEGGRMFDNRTAFKVKELNELSSDATFALRKHGSYLLMPSYLDVDKRFRKGIRIHRRFPAGDTKFPNLFERYIWLYHWERGEEEIAERQEGINFWKGSLWFINPGAFYGSYDTFFKPPMNLLRDFTDRLVTGGEIVFG